MAWQCYLVEIKAMAFYVIEVLFLAQTVVNLVRLILRVSVLRFKGVSFTS